MDDYLTNLLTEFRGLVAVWQDPRAPFTEKQSDRAIELAAEIDRCLSRGNRPPAQWTRPRS